MQLKQNKKPIESKLTNFRTLRVVKTLFYKRFVLTHYYNYLPYSLEKSFNSFNFYQNHLCARDGSPIAKKK